MMKAIIFVGATMKATLYILQLTLLASVSFAKPEAPNPTDSGPFTVSSAEYKLPAVVDQEILPNVLTELWAVIHWPEGTATIAKPLLVFLHGNHGTCGTKVVPHQDNNCSYTSTGICPAHLQVVQNHRGYDYLASHLASHGFIVVSINANRGITCGSGVSGDAGLNLARGRLILKHLEKLYEWNQTPTAPLELNGRGDALLNQIDFTEVGLMGHSRGGEGARAALAQFRDAKSIWAQRMPDMKIQGIFEIGAVDGQTSRVLDADEVAWNQLLPLCDGDVSDLQGQLPYYRMMSRANGADLTQKSLYFVWGANHNFYNTEWQQSDGSCHQHKPLFPATVGSPEQQLTALVSVSAFFRSHVGKKRLLSYNQGFNPLASIPLIVSNLTRVDREFSTAPARTNTFLIEDFSQPTGKGVQGLPHLMNGLKVSHSNSSASVSWEKAQIEKFLEIPFSLEGRDVTQEATLDFSIHRDESNLNTETLTQFSVQLIDTTGARSLPIATTDHAEIVAPGTILLTYQTIRIPIREFVGMNPTKISAVRFAFDLTPSGSLRIKHVRLSSQSGLGYPTFDAQVGPLTQLKREEHLQGPESQTVFSGKVDGVFSLANQIEIHVSSKEAFPVRNELARLEIDGTIFDLSRYPDSGDTHQLIFTLEPNRFQKFPKNATVRLHYGSPEKLVWNLGKLER